MRSARFFAGFCFCLFFFFYFLSPLKGYAVAHEPLRRELFLGLRILQNHFDATFLFQTLSFDPYLKPYVKQRERVDYNNE